MHSLSPAGVALLPSAAVCVATTEVVGGMYQSIWVSWYPLSHRLSALLALWYHWYMSTSLLLGLGTDGCDRLRNFPVTPLFSSAGSRTLEIRTLVTPQWNRWTVFVTGDRVMSVVWSVRRNAVHKNWMKPTSMHSSCRICGRQTAMTSVQLTTAGAHFSNELDKSAGCGWFEASSDGCVGWSGTEHYWQCHSTTSGTDISMPAFEPEEVVLNIHGDTNWSKHC